METAEFIYHYANIYHSENVKVTLAIENWSDKDFDNKYVCYLKEFDELKRLANLDHHSEGKILEQLSIVKGDRIQHGYKFLFDQMISKMRETRPVSDDQRDEFKARLEKVKSSDKFNFEYLLEIRKIEESFY